MGNVVGARAEMTEEEDMKNVCHGEHGNKEDIESSGVRISRRKEQGDDKQSTDNLGIFRHTLWKLCVVIWILTTCGTALGHAEVSIRGPTLKNDRVINKINYGIVMELQTEFFPVAN